MRPRLRAVALMLIAGSAATLVIAWGSALFVDLANFPVKSSAQSFDGHVQWRVQVSNGPAGVRVWSRRERGLAWSVEQVTGPPDTPSMGDQQTAWASESQDNQAEWLELDYANSVEPVAIHICESYNPGAVVKVTLFDPAGKPHVVRSGKPTPTTKPTGAVNLLKLPLDQSLTTRRIRIDLDSPAVPGWNEIDAVGLEDRSGKVIWAKEARASSTYASHAGAIVNEAPNILPRWSGLEAASPAFRERAIRIDERMVEGRGWPMIALRTTPFDSRSPAPIPIRPVWSGLAVDSIVNGLIIVALWWLLTFPARFVRESMRLRRGQCMCCGYDLQYNFPAGCPECGWRRELNAHPPTDADTSG